MHACKCVSCIQPLPPTIIHRRARYESDDENDGREFDGSEYDNDYYPRHHTFEYNPDDCNYDYGSLPSCYYDSD